ncbi:MAG: hypothetical protein WCB12_10765 [Bryobacteraceae bacterium]
MKLIDKDEPAGPWLTLLTNNRPDESDYLLADHRMGRDLKLHQSRQEIFRAFREGIHYEQSLFIIVVVETGIEMNVHDIEARSVRLPLPSDIPYELTRVEMDVEPRFSPPQPFTDSLGRRIKQAAERLCQVL